MNWQNLKINKCPKCNADFGYLAYSEPNFITCPKCKFRISHKRFSELVNAQVTADIEERLDREYEDTL